MLSRKARNIAVRTACEKCTDFVHLHLGMGDWLRDVEVEVPVRFIEGRTRGKAVAGRYVGDA